MAKRVKLSLKWQWFNVYKIRPVINALKPDIKSSFKWPLRICVFPKRNFPKSTRPGRSRFFIVWYTVLKLIALKAINAWTLLIIKLQLWQYSSKRKLIITIKLENICQIHILTNYFYFKLVVLFLTSVSNLHFYLRDEVSAALPLGHKRGLHYAFLKLFALIDQHCDRLLFSFCTMLSHISLAPHDQKFDPFRSTTRI